ncbi:MAG: glycosyl hydrolase [Terracidiphilus sp.]
MEGFIRNNIRGMMRITRRKFVTKSALCAGGMKLIPLLGSGLPNAQSADRGTGESLERLFESPAEDAGPWTYWYGNNGNITREAITGDLEAMHRVGIRGVLYMEVDVAQPAGPVRPLTSEWWELMDHATREATRLGMSFNMNNDGGWCGSGGPWITPELSMQIVVWNEIAVEGPKTISTALAQPKTTQGYYNDIAVLAFPIPPGDSKRMVDCSPRLTYGLDRKDLDFSKALDGNPGTITVVPQNSEVQGQYVNIDFPEPFTAQAVSISLDAWNNGMLYVSGLVQVSDDGKNYRTIREMSIYWPNSSANFERVSSHHYRIHIKPGATGWLWREYTNGIPLGEIQLHEGPRIEEIPGKALYLRQGGYSTEADALGGDPEFPQDTVIHSAQILDISKHMDSNGLLNWDVPRGRWTVLRLGHTSTGVMNEPAPKESSGLECDKLSKEAIEAHFEALVGEMLDRQAAAGSKSLKMTHIDSWEVGSQNWTLTFREEFQARRGYDPLRFLPILTGRAIESGEQSERFLWDLRRTIADLLLDNYAGRLRELCHRRGLTLSIEAYGVGPLDELAYAGRADVPMGEFWLGHGRGAEIFSMNAKAMSSSGHVYGRPIIAAEAFTADAMNAKWQSHPFSLKPLGDLAFTWGINRFVLSQFMMQPWPDRGPGMTLGGWGTQLDRAGTWWEQALPWHTYLARCQTLLQDGSFIADVAYLGSEGAPYSAPWKRDLDPAMPPGYDFDFLSPEVLLTDATVDEGRIVLKSGMSYRLLVLQPGQAMTPALLRKIKQLVKDGANVVGPRPVNSPSLSDFPRCDDEVRQLAEELWGKCDGSSIKENRLGAGRVIWGRGLSEILVKLGAPPDFDCDDAAVGAEIRFIHRNIGGDDFYFVASGVAETKTFLCTFRPSGKGKRPKLWWPDSGRIEPISVFGETSTPVRITVAGVESASRISIPISLDPHESVFVVFRESAEPNADHIVSVQRDGAAVFGLAPVVEFQFGAATVKQADDKGLIIEAADEGTYTFLTAAGHSLKAEIPQLPVPVSIQGPWELQFPRNLGAPDHVSLDRLISWTVHSDPGVKYFSGAATYRNRFTLPKGMRGQDRRLYLDLGRVCVIAEVELNGKDLGVFWKPPFMVDVTDVVAAESNDLEIRVVNLWPNRLIGDEQLPEDCEWGTPLTSKDPFPAPLGLPIISWPQWLLDNKPRPSGRVAFPTWKHWFKDDPLLESGLIGPVRIFAKAKVRLTS